MAKSPASERWSWHAWCSTITRPDFTN